MENERYRLNDRWQKDFISKLSDERVVSGEGVGKRGKGKQGNGCSGDNGGNAIDAMVGNLEKLAANVQSNSDIITKGFDKLWQAQKLAWQRRQM